jgi:2-polyprenyl-6-methoxyphenol hydroxylase-like FAD-dependent oxidoreductase
MAAALALARRGHEVTVLEAFAAPQPLGSGLLLQPTGLAALRSLGLEAQVRAAGARVDRLVGRDTRGRRVMDLDYAQWRPGAHGLGIHRGVLFATLLGAVAEAGVEVITAARIERIETLSRPRLHDAAGREHGPFDLVLIADGSASALRASVRPRAHAPVNRWGAVWVNADDDDDAFAGALRQVYHRAEVMTGVLPVGRGPDGRRQVSLFWSTPIADFDALTSSDFATWRDERLARLWPEAAALLAACPDWGAFSRATYRDVSVGRWSDGACSLIGDAAHGTSPQLGQGANLGLVDAVELAARLDAAASRPVAVSLPRSLAAWQASRRRHSGIYQLASRALTPLFQAHGGFWPLVRDWVFTPMSQLPGFKRIGVLLLTGVLRLGRFPSETRP